MSAIKITRGYGWMIGGKLFSSWRDGGGYKDNVPVHIIYGLSDDQLAAMMERERGVCEWANLEAPDNFENVTTSCGRKVRTDLVLHSYVSRPCWCGKKIKLQPYYNDSARPAGEG